MPSYLYKCNNCGAKFEKIQKYDDKPITRCRKCHTRALRRVYRPTAVVFKGSGWYTKDSKI